MSSDRGLPAATVEIVASVAAHRTLTTAQINAVHFPQRSRRWTQRVLARLDRADLLSFTRLPGSPGRLWFVSEAGARLAIEAAAVDPPKLLTAEQAAGQLHAHTLAVSDSAICFLEAARDRGDEFGPLSWRHEVAHPLTLGKGRRQKRLVADAVLTYVRVDGEDDFAVVTRFVELDRATLAVDALAGELARYADLYRAPGETGEPGWRSRYPVFPSVLCILAGDRRAVLERRRLAALALLRADPRSSTVAEVGVSVCLLEDLQRRGPFAPIFEDAHGARVNWLGDEG